MAEKKKPTGSHSHASETGGHGFERVVIKWFNPSKGVGFLSREEGPDVAFALERDSLPALSRLIGELDSGESVLVRFSSDRKYVTEIRRSAPKDRAQNSDLYARLALGEVSYTLDKSSEQLALEALKKAASNRSVVDVPPSHDEIVKESDGDKIVAVPGTPEQKDEGRLNEPLLRYLKAKNVPPEMWSDTAAEIERLVGKKLAAAVARPRWDDRAKYPELANLSAPLFLKRVWADQIGADGTIEKELVRQNDRSLMGTVDNYIAAREKRRRDAGDAEGLRFIARKTRPKMTRKTRPKAARSG
jgi:cold shock CspA family protein